METNDQNSSQQSKTLSLTVFWKDDGTMSFFKYDSEAKQSLPANVVTTGVANDVLLDLVGLSVRSSNDNGQVLRVFASGAEHRTLANGDIVVSNLHYSKFQPAGLQ